MGHKRIGSLPKSQRWRDIVRQIGEFDSSEVAGIEAGADPNAYAQHFQTLRNGVPSYKNA